MSETSPKIGLIGLGLLGTAIAQRLRLSRFRLIGYDIDEDKVSSLRTAGSKTASDATELFRTCDTVLLSLPTSDISSSLLRDVLSNVGASHRVSTVIDTTTGHPDEMIANEDFLVEYGISYLEATVAGSSSQLTNGDAVIFLGGFSEQISHHNELLGMLSSKTFHLGPVGAASRFKLVHNLILGLQRAVLAEGLTFANALGFDSQLALDVLLHTPAASEVMATKGPKMVNHNWQPQARLAQHLKDVRLILQQASQHQAVVPLSELHATLLEKCVQLGFGEVDNSAILEAFRSNASEYNE